MKLPGKNTLRKAFLAVAASATLTASLGGCAIVPATTDPFHPRPLPQDIYIQPIQPIPYITPWGPSYYNPTPYYHNDKRHHNKHHYGHRH